jgi:uncharacterized protein YjbI with pentapeptide repeats
MTIAEELAATQRWTATSRGANPDLSGIDLAGADLRGVDFTGATLAGANFRGAQLADAKFAWANLANADFTDATGLIGAQFARADLTAARLPAGLHFAGTDGADKIADGASKLFLTLLLVCAYSWLTINATLDAKLLTDTATSTLPILNAAIPIVNFYALVPIALVAVALVAMLQAQRLWSAVAAGPAVFPDGTTMSERASGWVIGPWAAERVAPAGSVGVLPRVQAWALLLLGWWTAPATIAWFWARYLHRHDWTITTIQILALVVATASTSAFLILADETLPRKRPVPATTTPPLGRVRLIPIVVGVVVAVATGAASFYSIDGVYRTSYATTISDGVSDVRPASVSLSRDVPALQALVPQLLSAFGVRPIAQLSEAELSTRLAATGVADTGADAKASGGRLVGTDLRFASAERLYAPLTDFRESDLLGANLWSADLRGTNVGGTSFVGALLYAADLRRIRGNASPTIERVDSLAGVAYHDTLFCGGVRFSAANLRYARLDQADVRGASFDDAMLQGATFARARLQHATFAGADLGGANFRGAIGLTSDQVLAARTVNALFDSTMLAELRTKSPARFAGYNEQAIVAADAAQRASGDVDPDSLSADDKAERDALIRSAFREGLPAAPSADVLARWVARGREAPASIDEVPAGCTMTRRTDSRVHPPLPRARAVTEPTPGPAPKKP